MKIKRLFVILALLIALTTILSGCKEIRVVEFDYEPNQFTKIVN